jgi:hypothetical protein
MPTKILIIGNILKGSSVLMRKKFAGSEPYEETWYSFGAEFVPGEDPGETFKKYIKSFAGVDVSPVRNFFWDTETKKDHDGIKKQFIYLDLECEYISGEPTIPQGHEKIEWIPIEKLPSIDVVPPSVIVFKKLEYLK